MKVCIHCKEEKELNLFYIDKHRKDGRGPICNMCKAKENRENYSRNKEIWKERVVVYRNNNKEKTRAWAKIKRALGMGVITRAENCVICNKKTKTEAHHWKGYTDEFALNIQWLCRACHKTEDMIKYENENKK